MKLAGITKIRNESEILQDTLDHYAEFCDEGIFVLDDASTDNSFDIAKNHPAVRAVIKNEKQNPNRWQSEPEDRQKVLDLAQEYLGVDAEVHGDNWLCYFDADERIEYDFDFDWMEYECVAMKLYDFYITPDDILSNRFDLSADGPELLDWKTRQWIGPEYRIIYSLFRNYPWTHYHGLDARNPILRAGSKNLQEGYIKHYSKAISIKRWEWKCNYFPKKYSGTHKKKWEDRRGKAIHKEYLSDFNNPLIKWEEKEEKGVFIREAQAKYFREEYGNKPS